MNKASEQRKISTLVDSSLKLRQQLSNSFYSIEDWMKIFELYNITDYLVKDNPSNCDVGSEANIKTKKLHSKRFGMYGK